MAEIKELKKPFKNLFVTRDFKKYLKVKAYQNKRNGQYSISISGKKTKW